jgi:putative nucleotidyltransferase with HDIG domain
MHSELDRRAISSLISLAFLIEGQHPYTAGHMWRVARFSTLLGRKLGLSNYDIITLRVAALLHDLGKVMIPVEILSKPGPLSQDEFAIVKAHPEVGSELIHRYSVGDVLEEIIRHHHESYDGNGYPDSLRREQIVASSRIIAIADAFDALTSARPYRKAMSIARALAVLTEQKDRQFDGTLVSAFLDIPLGELNPVIGYIPNGMRLIECLSCGHVISVCKSIKDGDLVLCRICGETFQPHQSRKIIFGEQELPEGLR